MSIAASYLAAILTDKKMPVYGDSRNVRDWLYVEDHCASINLILKKGKVDDVYNIGGHNERSNIDVVKAILKQLSESEDLIEYVSDRKGHDRRYAIDPTNIHNGLGWLSEIKFEDDIKATVQWYWDNRSQWENIISGDYHELL